MITRLTIAIAGTLLASTPGHAQDVRAPETTLGFYCGLQITYPYGPVYSHDMACMKGQALAGLDTDELPLSAPLPPNQKLCNWIDRQYRKTIWYQWTPRPTPADLGRYVEETRICYLGDRGQPKTMQTLSIGH